MKRYSVLTGGIMGIVVATLSFIFNLVALIEFDGYLYQDVFTAEFVFGMIASVALVVLSVFFMLAYNKNAKIFKKYNSFALAIISLFVFLVINNIIMSCTVLDVVRTLSVVLLGLNIATLVVVSYGFVTGNICKTQDVVEEDEVDENDDNLLILEEKVSKLNLMKENKLISEEEYNTLKSNYIKELMK